MKWMNYAFCADKKPTAARRKPFAHGGEVPDVSRRLESHMLTLAGKWDILQLSSYSCR